MRVYDKATIERFVQHLKQVPGIIDMTASANNPYSYFRYKRATEWGTDEWGQIYRNERGRFTLVGEAINDYKIWRQ